MRIDSLYRYPVKGLSPERLESVQVTAGEGFPLDRMYALLRTDVTFDPAAPTWLPKANFVMLMLHEQVAALKTRYTEQGRLLHIRTPDGHELSFAMNDAGGRNALGEFFLAYMPKRLATAPRLVESPGHQFTDKEEKFVSVINLASVRDRDVPGKLRAEFGHKDLGVYLKVTHAGVMKKGDAVEVEPGVGADRFAAGAPPSGADFLLCTACYYLFDPRKLNPAWTTAQDLPATYGCPDCGAGRDACIPAAAKT